MRALIVEDDRGVARAVAHVLEREGYTTDVVHDGASGLEYATLGSYDVIIFDVMLPLMDGVSAVAALRRRQVSTPVLMLTARGEVPDKIAGLDGGADLYMTKPFDTGELVARVRALTRRVAPAPASLVRAGDLELDETTRTLRCGGEEFQLINKEFLLARLFMVHAGQVITKAQIAEQVWEGEPVEGNSVEAYISMLRKKLKFLGSSQEIKVMRNVGYKLVPRKDAPC